MSTAGKGGRSREDTWGEKELAKYVGGGRETKPKASTSGGYGSPKSQPKDRSTKHSSGSHDPASGSTKHSSGSHDPASGSTKHSSGSHDPASGSTKHSSGSHDPASGSTKHLSPAASRKQGTSNGKGPSDSSKRTAEKSHIGGQKTDTAKKDGGKSREGVQRSTRVGGRQQAEKTDVRSQSGSKSDVRSQPGSKSDVRSQSGSKSDVRSQSGSKSDVRSQSGSKSLDPRRGEAKEGGARRKEAESGRGREGKDVVKRSSGAGRQRDRDSRGGRNGKKGGSREERREPGSRAAGGHQRSREKGLSDGASSRSHSSSGSSPHGRETERRRRREGEKKAESKRGGSRDQEQKEEEAGQVGGASAMGRGLQPMVEVTEDAMEEYQYDMDEDFQDYEEDFDEEFESSDSEEEGERKTTPTGSPAHTGRLDLVEIMEAIDAENRMVGMATQPAPQDKGRPSPPSPSFSPPSPPAPPPAPGRPLVDFSSAHKREVIERAARETKKRGQELLGLIELDIVTYDLFDLPPLSEYEVYIKNFGSNDSRQVSVQTGDDNAEEEAQTEEVGVADKWVQWPPEDLRGYGGPSDGEDDWLEAEPLISGQSTLRLAAFIKRATQVCSVLLEENLAAAQARSSARSSQSPFHSTKSPLSFCSTCVRIQTLPSFLAGRHATHVQFSPTQDYLLLAAYSQPSASAMATPLDSKGLLCVWNTREPSLPQSVLVCEATPTCCCFSPQKVPLVFAGNDDGSLVLWDLREPASMHQPPLGSQLCEPGTLPRVPTFSTAGIPHLDSHQAPVVSITPISADEGGGARTGALLDHPEEEAVGLSFQLASLDRAGRLMLWVVIQLSRPEPHGSESDLGLVPGGRVKLVKSASVEVCQGHPASQPSVTVAVRTNCVQFHPLDSSHLYIGADTGKIYHLTRYGRRPIPRHFLYPQPEACDVTSLSFSPWQPEHFLAGYSDGSIRLYHSKRATPLVTWLHSTAGSGLRLVQWSDHTPGLFLAHDSHSTVYIWDLLKNDAEPVHKEQLRTDITYCRLSPHCDSAHKPRPSLLLAMADGSLELHHLHDSLSPHGPSPDSLSPHSPSSDSFNTYLHNLG